jgi:hypothetical protein
LSLVAWGVVGALVAVRRFSRAATDEEGGVKRSWPWRRMLTE